MGKCKARSWHEVDQHLQGRIGVVAGNVLGDVGIAASRCTRAELQERAGRASSAATCGVHFDGLTG